MSGRSIAIAGCGVGGLAVAALLARAGDRVVVFDRLAAPMPLGSGLILQPVGLAALDEIGAGAAIRAKGARIARLFGKVEPAGRVVLDVRYRALGEAAPEGLGVHRGALFEALLRSAINAGADLVPGKEIVGASDGRLMFADGTTSAAFDLVIDALGVKSIIARPAPPRPLPFGALWANVDWTGGFDSAALEQRYERAHKMVGVLPIGEGPGDAAGARRQAAFFWSLRHGDHAAWRARPLDAWKADVLRLWPDTAPLLDQIDSHDRMIFAAYSHATLASPAARRLAHVGDSWHCASPQLGQGANMALLDALALARALAAHGDIAATLAAYAASRLWHIRLYQLASWMFTPAYQSDARWVAFVRDWLMAPASRIWPMPPLLAGLVSGVLGAPLAAIGRVRAPRSLPTKQPAN